MPVWRSNAPRGSRRGREPWPVGGQAGCGACLTPLFAINLPELCFGGGVPLLTLALCMLAEVGRQGQMLWPPRDRKAAHCAALRHDLKKPA
jgi:hypothetical protein